MDTFLKKLEKKLLEYEKKKTSNKLKRQIKMPEANYTLLIDRRLDELIIKLTMKRKTFKECFLCNKVLCRMNVCRFVLSTQNLRGPEKPAEPNNLGKRQHSSGCRCSSEANKDCDRCSKRRRVDNENLNARSPTIAPAIDTNENQSENGKVFSWNRVKQYLGKKKEIKKKLSSCKLCKKSGCKSFECENHEKDGKMQCNQFQACGIDRVPPTRQTLHFPNRNTITTLTSL